MTTAEPRAARHERNRNAWVPIRSLGPQQRSRIRAHLLALNESDRYLRFGYRATDAQISGYVDGLDFQRDQLFGIFNRKLDLIAMAHLAHVGAQDPDTPHSAMAEFGVSVLRKARGRGYGSRLFGHAVLHARNRGVKTLFIHALTENTAMLRIARKAGARIQRDGAESQAWIELPPETLSSQFEAFMASHRAEVDYRLKIHARQLGAMLGLAQR